MASRRQSARPSAFPTRAFDPLLQRRDDQERADSEHSPKGFGLAGVPKIQLNVDDGCDGCGDEADEVLTPKDRGQPDHARAHGDKAGSLENTNPDLMMPKGGPRNGVDEEDPRWLEVPDVTVRHLPCEDRAANHRVDALVTPVAERQEQKQAEHQDGGADRRQDDVGNRASSTR